MQPVIDSRTIIEVSLAIYASELGLGDKAVSLAMNRWNGADDVPLIGRWRLIAWHKPPVWWGWSNWPPERAQQGVTSTIPGTASANFGARPCINSSKQDGTVERPVTQYIDERATKKARHDGRNDAQGKERHKQANVSDKPEQQIKRRRMTAEHTQRYETEDYPANIPLVQTSDRPGTESHENIYDGRRTTHAPLMPGDDPYLPQVGEDEAQYRCRVWKMTGTMPPRNHDHGTGIGVDTEVSLGDGDSLEHCQEDGKGCGSRLKENSGHDHRQPPDGAHVQSQPQQKRRLRSDPIDESEAPTPKIGKLEGKDAHMQISLLEQGCSVIETCKRDSLRPPDTTSAVKTGLLFRRV